MFQTKPLDRTRMIQVIMDRYNHSRAYGRRVTDVADRHGETAEPCSSGFYTVRRLGRTNGLFVLTDSERDNSADRPARVAIRRDVRYSRSPNQTVPNRRRITMPRGQRAAAAAPARGRGRQAAAAPEPETNGGPKDYTTYRDKEPTEVMSMFSDWIIDEVYEGELTKDDFKNMEDAFRNGVRLGGTLRMEFQASDVNQERLAARRAAAEPELPARGRGRAAAAEEPAAPARGRGRGRQAAAAEPEEESEEEPEATPAPSRRTGRAAAQPAGRAADRPAGRGRRSAEAPY